MKTKNIELSHGRALLLAVFVTLLWSSSWILIKIGLRAMPPLLFAGIRYFAAFLLLALFTRREEYARFRHAGAADLWRFAGLGIAMYTLTQGAQILSLTYFPAVLPAMVLYVAPVPIAVLAWMMLSERPSLTQLAGVAICVAGCLVYFRMRLQADVALDWHLLIPFGGLISNVGAALIGRSLNRDKRWSPKQITLATMGIGSALLLAAGLLRETWPTIGWREYAILAWLIVANTAFAFTWWNRTLQTLTTLESSVINNTMTIQIALLAWIFLDEALSAAEIFALASVLAGILLVQLRRRPAHR